VAATLQSILALTGYTSLGVAAVAYGCAVFGSAMISSDVAVQLVVRTATPAALFCNVAVSIFASAVDGVMLASQDFSCMLTIGLSTFAMQLMHLSFGTSVCDIFYAFTLCLLLYTVGILGRVALGFGGVGRAIRDRVASPQQWPDSPVCAKCNTVEYRKQPMGLYV
jgi:hypothetical protein